MLRVTRYPGPAPTCAPSAWTGQQDATGHVRQPGFTRAR
jgi:hypothetical protein